MTMNCEDRVAVVGSPSTNTEVAFDVLADSAHDPIVGSTLYTVTPTTDGEDLAIGTVTEMTTFNQWHQNPAMRGLVKTRGHIPNMTGDVGDIRGATLRIQACYTRKNGDRHWRQADATLRNSPPTGAGLAPLTPDVIDELMETQTDLHYLGHMLHSDVPMPMAVRDFASKRGAFHSVFCGVSGAGKSALAEYVFASQLRHTGHGIIIIDPQGQWSGEQGMPFSLQEWAREMGRDVIVRRISEDLRLEKDAPLFGELLRHTRFFHEIKKMAPDTEELIGEELAKILRDYPNDWAVENSEKLMMDLVTALRKERAVRRIYSSKQAVIDLVRELSAIIGDVPDWWTDDNNPILLPEPAETATLRARLLNQFTPVHNLFSPHNPAGQPRHSLWGTVKSVFDENSRGERPAPLLILDMSLNADITDHKKLLASDNVLEAMEMSTILDQPSIKAAIVRQTCRSLRSAADILFKTGYTLNTQVVLDEAHRYAPPSGMAGHPEIAALSADLVQNVRDTRKYGIGWTFITQSPTSIAPEIWDQTTVRWIGYGLAGTDLKKVGDQLDDLSHLSLYRGFIPPDATTPSVYPFMVTGPVSPLSFTNAPVFLSVYTDFTQFRADNHSWIAANRVAQGKTVTTGTPTRTDGGSPAARPTRSPGRVRAANRSQTRADSQRIREHRDTGGVDPAASTGLSTDPTFTNALDTLDALTSEDTYTEPPF